MPRSKNTQSNASFRQLVKELRLAKGVTQTQLAKRLELPQSYVSKYETGERRLDFSETVIVCGALGISLKTFVDLYVKRLPIRKSSGLPPKGKQS